MRPELDNITETDSKPEFVMSKWMTKYRKPMSTMYCSEEGFKIRTMVWLLNLSK